MAELKPISIPCPACGEPIAIPATLTLPGRTVDGAAEAVASLDRPAIREHVEQHREA